MADVSAFRAFRYDLGRAGALRDLVAPGGTGPLGVARLLGDVSTAAQLLRDWLAEGILRQDSARSLYVCHQEFAVGDRRITCRGFFARVRLDAAAQAADDASADEESLLRLRAGGMNLRPVVAIYPDPAGEVQGHLERAIGRAPPLEIDSADGTVCRLWAVSDQRAVSAATGLMVQRALTIVEGWSEWQAAGRYLRERQALGLAQHSEAAEHFVLALLLAQEEAALESVGRGTYALRPPVPSGLVFHSLRGS
jgi:hypothetical protein